MFRFSLCIMTILSACYLSAATIQKPAIQVIGITCRTSNAPDAAPIDIPRLWEQFYEDRILEEIPGKINSDIIALYCDYEGDFTKPYAVVIGTAVTSLDQIPEGMVGKTIPAGAYATYTAIGEQPQATLETWGKIWQDSSLKRTYTGDYELYTDRFFSKEGPEVDVFIAVEG